APGQVGADGKFYSQAVGQQFQVVGGDPVKIALVIKKLERRPALQLDTCLDRTKVGQELAFLGGELKVAPCGRFMNEAVAVGGGARDQVQAFQAVLNVLHPAG